MERFSTEGGVAGGAGPARKGFRSSARRIWRTRIRGWVDQYYWPFIGGLWVFAITLGYLGWTLHFYRLGESHSRWYILYLTLQLFTVESGAVSGNVNWELEFARFFAPATTLYTAFSALAMIFREQLQMLRVKFLRDHVVICGLGRRGLLLAASFLELGDAVVVVEQNQQDELLSQCRELGAIVVPGDASDQEVLRRAGVHRAAYLISVCGQDGINAEIAVDARELVANRRGSPLKCVVQIDDTELCRLLKGVEISMGKVDTFRLEFFNTYLQAAKAWLEDIPPFEAVTEKAPHLLVIGLGRMGESLVVQAARIWRNLNGRGDKRFRVTFIDRNAMDKARLVALRNPLLEKACDMVGLDMDVRSWEFAEGAFLLDANGTCDVTAVYVCLDDDSRGLAAALAMLKRLRGLRIPIVVRMAHEGGLETLLHGADTSSEGFGSLYAFGLLERTCLPDLVLGGTHEMLAQAIHQQQVEAAATGDQEPGQVWNEPRWNALPEEYREACRRHADHLASMLKSVDCTIEPLTEWDAQEFAFDPEETEALARSLHEFYLEECRRGGSAQLRWFRRASLDVNPGPLSWEEGSEESREFFRLLVTQLPAFLGRVDFQIYRVT